MAVCLRQDFPTSPSEPAEVYLMSSSISLLIVSVLRLRCCCCCCFFHSLSLPGSPRHPIQQNRAVYNKAVTCCQSQLESRRLNTAEALEAGYCIPLKTFQSRGNVFKDVFAFALWRARDAIAPALGRRRVRIWNFQSRRRKSRTHVRLFVLLERTGLFPLSCFCLAIVR